MNIDITGALSTLRIQYEGVSDVIVYWGTPIILKWYYVCSDLICVILKYYNGLTLFQKIVKNIVSLHF